MLNVERHVTTSTASFSFCLLSTYYYFCLAVSVVTGCTGGIGEAFCSELAACGVNVVLVSRNILRLQEVSSNLGQHCSLPASHCLVHNGLKLCFR